MFSGFWQWLHEIGWLVAWRRWLQGISQSQATFLGWVVGVVTLVGGALFNARLNRKRDDRLRKEDQRAMAVALKTELAGWKRHLEGFVERAKAPPSVKLGFPLPTTRLLPDMVPKLGLFRSATIDQVIGAYDDVEHLTWALLWMGDEMDRSDYLHSRWITVPPQELSSAVEQIEATAKVLERAIAELDHYEPLVRRGLRRF
jgi:hypothetical protein